MSPAALPKRSSLPGITDSPNDDGNGSVDVVDEIGGNCSERHEHFNMLLVDEIMHADVDDLFAWLFTDSALFQEFIKRRRTYDVKLSDWSTELDEEGRKQRNLSYTLTLNFSIGMGIGPKSSPSTEKQVMYPESIPGERYLIDAECYNGGFPYSDNFRTVIRYCLTRAGPGATRVIISGRVVYVKNVMGLIKGLVHKTAMSGCTDSFSVLADLLRRETEVKSMAIRPSSLLLQRHNGLSDTPSEAPSVVSDNSLPTPVRRRRRTPGQPSAKNLTPSFPSDKSGFPSRDGQPVNNNHQTAASKTKGFVSERLKSFSSDEHPFDAAEVSILMLFITVVALVVFNVSLYYQLTSLESTLMRSLVFRRDATSVG